MGQEGCLRSRASGRSLVSWHLRLTILRPARPATRFQLFVLSFFLSFPLPSFSFKIVSFFRLSLSLSPLSVAPTFHERFLFPSPALLPSLFPVYMWTRRCIDVAHARTSVATHKDVPRTRVNYYGASSRFYSPSGWRAYHRHLVSHD